MCGRPRTRGRVADGEIERRDGVIERVQGHWPFSHLDGGTLVPDPEGDIVGARL